MEWAGHVELKGEKTNAYIVLWEQREGGRPPGRLSIKWENNVRLDLKEIRYDCVEWDQLALDRDKGLLL